MMRRGGGRDVRGMDLYKVGARVPGSGGAAALQRWHVSPMEVTRSPFATSSFLPRGKELSASSEMAQET